MEWPEEIANDLPARRPDEPPTLRSDILDELADHLQSSLEHEQIRGNDEQSAKQSVLSKFGNPSTIACQLWWDAMWGKIMIQRITLGFVAVLCACSIFATFLIWQSVQQSQQVTTALVEQVQRLADRDVVVPASSDNERKYLDWIPVTVKLEYENGEPVTDAQFAVKLQGDGLLGSGGDSSISRNPEGTAPVDFGFVKPGRINLEVVTPWKETMTTQISVGPGQPYETIVICPRERRQPSKKLQVAWPDDFRERKLWTLVGISSSIGARTIGTNDWKENFPSGYVLLSPESELYETELRDLRFSGNTFSWRHLPRIATAWDENFKLDEMAMLLKVKSSPNPQVLETQTRAKSFLKHLQKNQFEIVSPKRSPFLWSSADQVRLSDLWILNPEDDKTAGDLPKFHIVFGANQNVSMTPAQSDPDLLSYEPTNDFVEVVREGLKLFDAQRTESTTDTE